MTSTDRTAMFLAGMGIGFAGAVLFAPHAGNETRRRIKNGASDAADQLNGLFEKGKSSVSSLKDKAVDKSRDLAHQVGKKIEEAGKRVQEA